MDIVEDLKSLQFEYEISEEDRSWLYLLGRSRGLLIEGCAHAVFFCKLLCNLRKSIHENQNSRSPSVESVDLASTDYEKLKVGIIGGGNLGKQLTRALLQLVPIPAESLCISTRRPEDLTELQKLGIQCFYHNSYLVVWANVIFLCCLPSQLPHICLEIQNSLKKTCIVYSFVAATPLPRLKLLLNTTNILRPKYQCAKNFDNIWGANKEIAAALQDPVILRATCPYSPAGGITLNIKWLEGVFYAVLNSCTASNIAHPQVLQLLNKVFLSVHYKDCKTDQTSCPTFHLADFVNTVYMKNMYQKRPFPWFDLTDVQLKETPFSQRLSSSTVLQDHLTHLYCASFGLSVVNEDQPVVSTDSPSQ
ncbi:NADP-dependent oxidoreductase domain-containing protein 1 [Erethizon dorsatum]